jgi:hypothetical protein
VTDSTPPKQESRAKSPTTSPNSQQNMTARDIPRVSRRFIPFQDWLLNEYRLKNYSRLPDNRKLEMIGRYLNANRITTFELGEYKGKETAIRFQLEETRGFWHECTWWAIKIRGKKDYDTEFDSTLIKEPYIEWFMAKRGTPAIRIEKNKGGRYLVYFYSPRYNWICKQDFKDIRKHGTDADGNIVQVSTQRWLHQFECVCGKTEYIENLLWSKYSVIMDENDPIEKVNLAKEGRLASKKVSGTSFDGYRYTFSVAGLLQGQPEERLTIYSAEDKTEYLREKLSRLGYVETGRPYQLDRSFDASDGVVKGKRIPYWHDSPTWGMEKFSITWRSEMHIRIDDGDKVLQDDQDDFNPVYSLNRRQTLKYAWDQTEFIKDRFSKCGYQIPEDWKYGRIYKGHSGFTKSKEKIPIPFLWNGKWYRISWNYFSSGVRVDEEKLLYFIRIKWNGILYNKIGITKSNSEIRFKHPDYEVVQTYYQTARRPHSQIKEVEDIVLFSTRRYTPKDEHLKGMSGGSECRSLDMDCDKILALIKKVFRDIDEKWASIKDNLSS